MRKLSLGEILLAEYFILVCLEAGMSFEKISELTGKKGMEVVQFILKNKTKTKFLLDKKTKEALFHLQLLHESATMQGSSAPEIIKPILRREWPQGFCKKAASRTALRSMAMGHKAGLNSDQSVQFYLEKMHGKQAFAKKGDALSFLKNALNEKSLLPFFELLDILKNEGADMSDFFLFAAGSSKI